MTLMRQVFCLPFPTYNDGSGMYNLNKTFGFTKRGTWRLKEFTTSSLHPRGGDYARVRKPGGRITDGPSQALLTTVPVYLTPMIKEIKI